MFNIDKKLGLNEKDFINEVNKNELKDYVVILLTVLIIFCSIFFILEISSNQEVKNAKDNFVSTFKQEMPKDFINKSDNILNSFLDKRFPENKYDTWFKKSIEASNSKDKLLLSWFKYDRLYSIKIFNIFFSVLFFSMFLFLSFVIKTHIVYKKRLILSQIPSVTIDELKAYVVDNPVIKKYYNVKSRYTVLLKDLNYKNSFYVLKNGEMYHLKNNSIDEFSVEDDKIIDNFFI